MHITFESVEDSLFEEGLKKMFKKAYEQGVADAKQDKALPYTLKKQDLAELFQVELPTVEKIIRMEGFPKSKVAAARYPRILFLNGQKQTQKG